MSSVIYGLSKKFERRLTLELAVASIGIVVASASYYIVYAQKSERLITPPITGLLLVLNLLPWMALLFLVGNRIAYSRAAASETGVEGTLHARLVAVFSLLASVPMLLITVFASLLFQYGVDFWFSDRARNMLAETQALTQESYRQIVGYVERESLAMSGDLLPVLQKYGTDDPAVTQFFAAQAFYRSLTQAALFEVTASNEPEVVIIYNPTTEDLPVKELAGKLRAVRPGVAMSELSGNQARSIVRLPGRDNLYLYVARAQDLQKFHVLYSRANALRGSYDSLLDRARIVQLRFNAALLGISLLIVGLAVFVALAVADRLVRPVGALVDAARRVADGDLSARVPESKEKTRDELGTLASAFNSMTERLEEQTGELIAANAQIDSRRALIEAVMSGVSAGVVSVGPDRTIRLANSSATALLKTGTTPLAGRALREVAPELDQLLEGDTQDAIIQLATGGEAKTLAVRITRDDGQHILTFDDITQQLLDQRRAAWSDVARRIAHEIKNPLTPIQLAAERLQRRYGSKLLEDDGTFVKLTGTIVRQVGDLRRMVDEFSSFARMPKPMFRDESVADLARQSLFLHEVAHPDIDYMLDADGPAPLVCDRRQLGQALTNIVKNATEAVEARTEPAERGRITIAIRDAGDGRMQIDTSDNGIGLPAERDRIVEPYMTTRKGGTGLGLAIVRKIVEEHFGTISFADRPGGGTIVSITLDTTILAALAGTGGSGEDTAQEVTSRHPMLTRTGSHS